MNDARSITLALGGQWHKGKAYGTAKCVAHDDRTPSLSILAGRKGGVTVVCHAGCDWRTIRAELCRRGLLAEWQPGDGQDRRVPAAKLQAWDRAAVDAQAEDRQRTEDDLIRIKRAVSLWDAAVDPRGELPERYLHEQRHLELPDDLAGSVLRFLPRCPWRNENSGKTDFVPALIAAFRCIDDDEITAIHRIALNPDGTKIGRRMLGVVHRAAVKLDALADSVAIGEGIETAMAARQLGIRPAWALGSVGAISFFPLLPGVSTLRILAEAGEASNHAVELCGTRWRRAGRRVKAIRPTSGSDLNDVLIARQHGRTA